MPKSTMRDIIKSPRKKSAGVELAPPVEAKEPPKKGGESAPEKNFWSNFDISKKSNIVTPASDAGSKLALWIIATVSVIILFFALSTLFTGATVTVSPKQKEFVLVQQVFKAEKGNQAELSFDIMALSDSESRTVPSTKTEMVERKAQGIAIIYNNYSSEPQKLVATTRLETPEGKIYRLDEGVTVPGQKTLNGQTVPGSVEVSIHAAEPGEEYNIQFADFTIPGLKGSPKFEKFYARSKTEISGGVKGMVSVVDEAEAKKIKDEIIASLEEKLAKKARSETPAGFILYDDAIFTEIKSEKVNIEGAAGGVPVTVELKLSALILDEDKLAMKVAETAIADFDPAEEIYIPDLRKFVFSIEGKNDLDLSELKEFNFSLSGSGTAVWKVDEEKLRADLLGKPKKDLPEIMKNYPGILRADAVVKPFWRSTFPGRKDDITIINTAIVD